MSFNRYAFCVLFVWCLGAKSDDETITSHSPEASSNITQSIQDGMHQLVLAGFEQWQPVTEPITCQKLTEKFCDTLTSVKNDGNLRIPKAGPYKLDILKGGVNGNQVSTYRMHSVYTSALANMPNDLKQAFDKFGFKDSLNNLLKLMGQSDSPERNRLIYKAEADIKTTIDIAVSEVGDKRFEAKRDPDRKGQPYSEKEYQSVTVERTKARREFFESGWKHSNQYQNMKDDFELVRTEYLKWINEQSHWPSAVRERFRQRVKTIKLAYPGLITDNFSQGCSTTEDNAYYYPTKHELTICGGYIGGRIHQTIAHEISHSLDPNSDSRFLFYSSPKYVKIKEHLINVCKNKNYDCEKHEGFTKLLQSKTYDRPYSALNSQYYSCLIARPLKEFPSREEFKRILQRWSASNSDMLASGQHYSDLLIPTTIFNKKETPSVNYEDPCVATGVNKYDIHIDTNAIALTQFLYAYKCADKDKSEQEKISEAISYSRQTFELITEDVVLFMGITNSNQELVQMGVTASIGEKFADNFALQVTERILKTFKTQGERQSFMLANLAGYCPRPVEKIGREMREIEKKFSSRPHSLNTQRVQELISPEIATLIGCSKGEGDINTCKP